MASVSGGQVRAGPVSAPVIPLALLGMGLYLAWFGVHYWRSDVTWPTTPVKAVLQGKPVPQPGKPAPENAALLTDIQQATHGSSQGSGGGGNGSGSGLGGGGGGGNPVPSQTAEHNQGIAKLLCAPYGWSPGQNNAEWDALVKVWTRESSWDNTALNPQSGAFGIAQALGHGGSGTGGKYGNQYPSKAANNGDPTAQIEWGLQYIKQRYGDPLAAWAHEESAGWY